MLAWSIIQRLSRTGLFIPTSLVSCWLLMLREWDGGVEHLQRHFSEKINISESRMQQCRELVKAQTAARRICWITLIWEIFFSCTYIARGFFLNPKPTDTNGKFSIGFRASDWGHRNHASMAPRSQLGLLSAVNYLPAECWHTCLLWHVYKLYELCTQPSIALIAIEPTVSQNYGKCKYFSFIVIFKIRLRF